ncbi:hypothetical protein NXF25_004697 [Crotalus adamanteus]|uniref:Uncharacterized protein n=1 Tax=Crotalus adamanteus TaxID=8729 RepID=A0AAW1BV87_CROAD
MKLLSKEDEMPVRVVCRESRVHKIDPMLPIKETAQDCKKKIAIHVKARKEKKRKTKRIQRRFEQQKPG